MFNYIYDIFIYYVYGDDNIIDMTDNIIDMADKAIWPEIKKDEHIEELKQALIERKERIEKDTF